MGTPFGIHSVVEPLRAERSEVAKNIRLGGQRGTWPCSAAAEATNGSVSYIQSATLDLVVISGFEWDEDNILHVERHRFTPEEVEEVFAGDHRVRRTRQKLYIALGETLDGRLVLVVFRRLPGGLIRVITARDMDDSERRLFRRK